jgi:formylmethanofuran dehydrogenase subunit B
LGFIHTWVLSALNDLPTSTCSTSSTSSTSSTCLGCGCACDDIDVRAEQGVIVEARNACTLGVKWFGDGRVPARVVSAGRDVTMEHAVEQATDMVGRAARPLVLLAPDISCETQRAAIGLSDLIRAAADSVTSMTARAALLAAQEIGRAGATLGEIRNRADLVVFWGVDPAVAYPRFQTRYAPDVAGMFVDGRRSRTVIAVDVGESRGPEDADGRVTVMPDREGAMLTELTASLLAHHRGVSVGGGHVELIQTLTRSKYVALVADGEQAVNAPDSGRVAGLTALTQLLNSSTRCALILLRGGGNRSGADACFTSQTGYPMAVDFSRGYPRYLPFQSSYERLAAGIVDVTLVVGSMSSLPDAVLQHLLIPRVVAVGPRASESVVARNGIAIDTGVAGVHEAGTALRMDDVPLPLEAILPGPPSAASVIDALRQRMLATGIAKPLVNQR